MAILMAFQSPELEILGLTTIFGNTNTEDSTRNALLLVCNQLIFVFFCMICFMGKKFLEYVHDQLVFLICKRIV